MANLMLGFPNLADSATLSGGAWASTLPRANLQNRTLGKKARTSDATTASTKVDIDLGSTKNIRVLALIAHNLSLTATYRVRGSAASDFSTTVYDSGSGIEVWPVVYPNGSLDWEEDNWWSSKYTDAQRAGVNWNLIHILPANKLARYWRIEITDTTNAAGYIEAGRLFIGPAWQPTYNMSYGCAVQLETPTTVQEALSGAETFQRRTIRRVNRFVLDVMTVDEGMANAYEIQRRAGIDGEVLFIFDPDDTVHAIRRQYLARLRTLSPIEYPMVDNHKAPFEVKELL